MTGFIWPRSGYRTATARTCRALPMALRDPAVGSNCRHICCVNMHPCPHWAPRHPPTQPGNHHPPTQSPTNPPRHATTRRLTNHLPLVTHPHAHPSCHPLTRPPAPQRSRRASDIAIPGLAASGAMAKAIGIGTDCRPKSARAKPKAIWRGNPLRFAISPTQL